jgi:hypothetical protein
MVTNVSASRLYTKRCVSVIIMLFTRGRAFDDKCEVPIKMSATRFPPLLASKNGGYGALLAAGQTHQYPRSADRPQSRTGRPHVLAFHLCTRYVDGTVVVNHVH